MSAPPKSIQSLLRNHTITAEQLLTVPNIASQIRSNLLKFTNYCRTHRVFTTRMIQLAFDVSYQELEDPQLSKASYTAHQIFGNQEQEIVELFFQPPAKPEPESEIKEEEEVVGGIQSQAERLFDFDDDYDDVEVKAESEEPREQEITREELVALSLQILNHPTKNQTCLGHLQKMYSFFIRHEPIPVLTYFQSHPQMLQLLLNNLQFSSIGSWLAQLLTSEDKNKEYKYQPLKKSILQKAIEQIFLHLSDSNYFQGAIIFLEQILNATKQSYFQYFQDFKRISNYLVSAPVINRFYTELCKMEEISFSNISKYLELLLTRINSQGEDNRYYHKEESEPTMSFEIGVLIENLPGLFLMTERMQAFSSITKIHYLSFIEALLNSVQVKAIQVSVVDPSFLVLFDLYKRHASGGITKNKIYHIIKELLSRASETQLKELLEQHPALYEDYFTTIKAANYANTKHYNKNESSAFDIGLIAQLTKKEEATLLGVSKIVGKDLKRILKKYSTKIASFQNNSAFALEEESNFFQYNTENIKSSEGNGGFNLSIGKNNISIPVLQLPDRYQTAEAQSKQSNGNPNSPDLSPTELHQSPLTTTDAVIEPKEVLVIEEEEVVVLTSKINSDMGLNLSEVIEEMKERQNLEKKLEKIQVSPVKDPSPRGQGQEENIEVIKLTEMPSVQAAKVPSQQVVPKVSSVQVPSVQVAVKVVAKPCKVNDSDKARFFSRHLAIFA